MGKRFEGRVAIVTGAAKGMGKATAIEMCVDGAWVMITDIDKPGLVAAGQEIKAAGGKITTHACDISVRSQVDELIARTKRELGRLDILVNNAGLLFPGTIEETTDDIIGRTLAINVKGILTPSGPPRRSSRSRPTDAS